MTIPMRAYWQLVGLLSLGTLAVSSGCTTARSTNTARTGLEQLLVSNAVDQAYDRMDFSNLRGRAVFVDEKYLDCVDKNYVAAALRQRVLWSGGRLAAKAEDADIVLEIASGGVGTDNTDSFIGMPPISIPLPLPVSLPEVRLWNRTSQKGTAKLCVTAYDAKGHQLLNQGGQTLAQSDDNKWYVMGVGPFQDGSVREELHRSKGETGWTRTVRQTLSPSATAAQTAPSPAQPAGYSGPLPPPLPGPQPAPAYWSNAQTPGLGPYQR